MSVKKNISEFFLNKSHSYQFYKDSFDSNKKKLKKIERENKKLKKSNKELKEQMKFRGNSIDFLLNGGEVPEKLAKYCPICKNINYYKPYGVPPRNAMCPVCGSLERDRFFQLIKEQKFPDIFDKPCKVLHFAPESILYSFFTENKNIDYFPVDFCPEIYAERNINIREKVNMEEIPYENNTFDFIYNSHVLEHVPDDIKGMGELRRVLKEDGICITTVPLSNIPETFENEEYNTPELRLKYFGQRDHLRRYGNDFKDRLESVGFNVEELKAKDIMSDDNKRKVYGLLEHEKFFICRK